ncbi:sensor histidine kinase [Pedobacter duraquae]|uniref:Histidine kinase n=1 Tax=Pedobacter duraquae TaxID=425511 RepID=A0A4R6IK88_9SPHI|nr:histidine kinase [Pedobacter duraquae]TDO22443.1 histidine kinase [Pedobacter duraquae]
MVKKIFVQNWFYQFIPLLLWLVFALLPFLFPQSGALSGVHKNFVRDMFYRNLLILIIFYFHAYLLFPALKQPKGWILYGIGILVCFLIYLSVSRYIHPSGQDIGTHFKATMPGPPPFNPFFAVPPFAVSVLSSYCYCILLNINSRERALSRRENAQLKTELTFLRSQISPHFMFNVLNSMVSLARKNSELLEASLINMSNLMRYMLYERNGNHIALNTEVEYLKNYVDLQLLRYGDTVKLNMYISGHLEQYRIEPMLLIPFVENAFKHGLSMVENPLIDIFITLTNSTLQFVVLNNISPVADMEESETGIGLQNIKRRLELLYPGKYSLKVSTREEVFKAELIIKLDS